MTNTFQEMLVAVRKTVSQRRQNEQRDQEGLKRKSATVDGSFVTYIQTVVDNEKIEKKLDLYSTRRSNQKKWGAPYLSEVERELKNLGKMADVLKEYEKDIMEEQEVNVSALRQSLDLQESFGDEVLIEKMAAEEARRLESLKIIDTQTKEAAKEQEEHDAEVERDKTLHTTLDDFDRYLKGIVIKIQEEQRQRQRSAKIRL